MTSLKESETKIDRVRYMTALQSYTALLDLQSHLHKGCKSRDLKKQNLLLFAFHHIKILRTTLQPTDEVHAFPLEQHLRTTLQILFGLLADCDDGRFD